MSQDRSQNSLRLSTKNVERLKRGKNKVDSLINYLRITHTVAPMVNHSLEMELKRQEKNTSDVSSIFMRIIAI